MLVIIGKEFEGWTAEYVGHRRALTPIWNDEIVAPRLIGQIIDWCLLKDKEIREMNWKGEIIALGGCHGYCNQTAEAGRA